MVHKTQIGTRRARHDRSEVRGRHRRGRRGKQSSLSFGHTELSPPVILSSALRHSTLHRPRPSSAWSDSPKAVSTWTCTRHQQHRSPQNLHANACALWSNAPAEAPRLSGQWKRLTTVQPRSRRRRKRLTLTPRPRQHRRPSTTTTIRRPPRTALVH